MPEGERVGGNGERYFEARAWESVDRRFERLEATQAKTAEALQRLADVGESNSRRFDAYMERQRRFWRSWRVVIVGLITLGGTVLVPTLNFLHSIHVLGWR